MITSRVYEIVSRHRENPAQPCLLKDFTLGPDAGAVPEAIWDRPDWSLYCLDFAEEAAVFVQADGKLDLQAVPFVYQAQFEQAARVLVMPLDEFLQIGLRLPDPQHLTFLYSTGRCGSTLASRIFAELPGVISLSEPEAIVSAAHQAADVTVDHWPYIRAATRFLCRGHGRPDGSVFVIKPRPVSILYDRDFAEACPAARFAFLYRDCQAYVSSMFRFGQRLGLPWDTPGPVAKWRADWDQMAGGAPVDELDRFVDTGRDDIAWSEVGAALWALNIRAYIQLDPAERQLAAIHYDDLNADRERGTAKLLAACGLDPDQTQAGLRAFARDSHSGGKGANAIPSRGMGTQDVERLNAVIAKFDFPDFAEARL
ncbi:MAG: hypothetical protein QNJ16_18050 [Rhodobacter sp.]|nr:hypothetical protein [Rhodobacter sp.]